MMIIIEKHQDLWKQCIDQPASDDDNTITDFNETNAITNSFKIKDKRTDQTGNDGTKKGGIVTPLKYLSNFWRTPKVSLIDCEIILDLKGSKNWVIVATNVAAQATTF